MHLEFKELKNAIGSEETLTSLIANQECSKFSRKDVFFFFFKFFLERECLVTGSPVNVFSLPEISNGLEEPTKLYAFFSSLEPRLRSRSI